MIKIIITIVVPNLEHSINLGWAPNLHVRMGRKFPTIRRPTRANPAAHREVLRPLQ